MTKRTVKKSEYLFSQGWVRMRVGVTIWTHERYPKAKFLFGMAWKMQKKYEVSRQEKKP